MVVGGPLIWEGIGAVAPARLGPCGNLERCWNGRLLNISYQRGTAVERTGIKRLNNNDILAFQVGPVALAKSSKTSQGRTVPHIPYGWNGGTVGRECF